MYGRRRSRCIVVRFGEQRFELLVRAIVRKVLILDEIQLLFGVGVANLAESRENGIINFVTDRLQVSVTGVCADIRGQSSQFDRNAQQPVGIARPKLATLKRCLRCLTELAISPQRCAVVVIHLAQRLAQGSGFWARSRQDC